MRAGSVAMRGLTSAALVGFAVMHLKIAGQYRGIGRHPVSLSDQFYLQAAIAFLLAAALLARPRRLVWLASAAFAAGSLAVLVYSRYRTIPVYGFPGGFQEGWDADEAKPVAWIEGIALALSLAGVLKATRSPEASIHRSA
ncbi:MAG: hypothetical protein QOG99_1332 [Frankiales bacterium]|jgi:hypothetical protein|nr:hypothetical protein [Frankiales bacterium]